MRQRSLTRRVDGPPPLAAGRPDPHVPGQLVYYKWMGEQYSHDRVPSYATSIEGVAAVVLSPDEQRILLIWEYGHWKLVQGAVDPGESKLFTVGREMREEVGIEVDHSFTAKYLGGWQKSKARDYLINDNLSCFAMRAKAEVRERGAAARPCRTAPPLFLCRARPRSPHLALKTILLC